MESKDEFKEILDNLENFYTTERNPPYQLAYGQKDLDQEATIYKHNPYSLINLPNDIWICVAYKVDGDSVKFVYSNNKSEFKIAVFVEHYPVANATPVITRSRTMIKAGGAGGNLRRLLDLIKNAPSSSTHHLLMRQTVTNPPFDDVYDIPNIVEENPFEMLPDDILRSIIENVDPELVFETSSTMSEVSKAMKKNMQSITLGISDDEKTMHKREQLYLFIIMLCILERQRLRAATGYISISCKGKLSTTTCFTITTKRHPANTCELNRYMNYIQFSNGVVVTLSYFAMSEAELEYTNENMLYKIVKKKCKPQFMANVIKKALQYRILALKDIRSTPTENYVKVTQMLEKEIVCTRNLVESLLNMYIYTLKTLRFEVSDLLFREIGTLQYIGVLDGLICYILTVVELILTRLKDPNIMNAPAFEIKLPSEHLEMLQTNIASLVVQIGVTTCKYMIKAHAWLKTANDSTYYECGTTLLNLHILLVAILNMLCPGHDIILFELEFIELCKVHLPNVGILRLVQVQVQVQDDGLEKINTLLQKSSKEYAHNYGAHYTRHRMSYLDLLLDTHIISHSKTSNNKEYSHVQSSVKEVDGLASMCFCGKSTVTIDGTEYPNGFTFEEIEAFADININICVSVAHHTNPDYSLLTAHYISDFFRCMPEKLRDYIVPASNFRYIYNKAELTLPNQDIIVDLQNKQHDIWALEDELLQHQTPYIGELQTVVDTLSRNAIYIALFERIRNLYKPLLGFVGMVETAITYIGEKKERLSGDGSGIPPVDIFGTKEYQIESFDDSGDEEVAYINAWDQVQDDKVPNEMLFNRNIAPLLSEELLKNIKELRENILSTPMENIILPTLHALVHSLNVYITSRQTLMKERTYHHLIDCIVNNKKFNNVFTVEGKYQPDKASAFLKRIKATNFKPFELIKTLRMLSFETFTTTLPNWFKRALYCYIFSTNNVMILKDINRYKDYKIPNSIDLETKIRNLAVAEESMQKLIDSIHPQPSSHTEGGGGKRTTQQYLMVTHSNTNTLRTIHKPIFKVNNQSKVRHNGELVLVSKYKLILGKRHNRQVEFAIVRKEKRK
jgi:hypothetical protein